VAGKTTATNPEGDNIMTDKNLTSISILLDRSGSMQSIREDTIGGYAAFIEEQRKNPGTCRVSLSQFDTEYEQVYADLALADVPPLRLEPRGSTALLDSVGRLVTDLGARLAALPEPERPGSVIVGIVTDGMENASQEWTHPAIRALITQQTEQYDWTFLYMGANQDAIEVGMSMGVDADLAMTYAGKNVGKAFRSKSLLVNAMRCDVAAGASPRAARAANRYTQEQRDEAMDES
jgi:hypothetical protein